ncbi:MAG: acyl-CoA desaturase [Flavobacteriales bacterium]|nr:MAG: acyl-CoA desaturase [Flavobacteriales bacterium]
MRQQGQVKFVPKDRSAFHATLRQRVDEHFRTTGRSRHANAAMIVKTVVLLTMYLAPFVLLLTLQPGAGASIALWAIMGFGLAGIGMSVMHDANHGAYSANERVNWWLGHTLNLLGGSTHNWKLQHNILHHTYTNITHVDDDIADRLVLKFSPHTGKRWYHRFQWLYATLFYGLLTLYWVVAKDFVQFKQYAARGVMAGSASAKRSALLRIIGLKVVYLALVIGLPLALGLPWLQVVLGFLLMHFIAGAILTLVFQLAHTVEGTDHPLPDAHGVIADDWAAHQLRTTVDFSPGNGLLSWYVGGLNYQIEHHLFPRIAHVHYPDIAPIVERTAREFGLPYMVNPTLLSALRSHFALMRRIGLPSLNEAIG